MLESHNGLIYTVPAGGDVVSAAGFVALAGLPAALRSGAALTDRCFPLRPSTGGKAARGVHIWPYSTEADDAAISLDLWVLRGLAAGPSATPDMFGLFKLGTAALTVGSGTGVAGALVDNTNRWCDTAVFTASAYGTAIFTGLAAADPADCEYSPADNTPACLVVPDLGGAAWLVLDADKAMGAVIERVT